MSKKKAGRKPISNPRNISVTIRLTTKEWNRLYGLAKLYTDGDVSIVVRQRLFDGQTVGRKTDD